MERNPFDDHLELTLALDGMEDAARGYARVAVAFHDEVKARDPQGRIDADALTRAFLPALVAAGTVYEDEEEI